MLLHLQLQISISRIHIRYEDRISNPGHPFAFGITLQSLQVSNSLFFCH